MARNPSKLQRFRAELATLDREFPQELQLPSLRNNRLEGFAALFVTVLPLLDSEGEAIFTDALIEELVRFLNHRFGGLLIPSASSHPPYWGLWRPTGNAAAETEKDYVTTIQVFTNPIEPTTELFRRLKQILKTAGNTEQQEILISRFDCWLV